MNKDSVEGKAKEVAGGAEERFGRAIGDERREAAGQDRQAEGRVQGFWGRLKSRLHI